MKKLNAEETIQADNSNEVGGIGACLVVCTAICVSSSMTLTGTAVLSGAFAFL